MKERLNLTIDRELLEAMKAYAAGKQMSVSELVEGYFRHVTKPVQRENILDLVDRLEAPAERNGLGRRRAAELASGAREDADDDGPAEREPATHDGLAEEEARNNGI